MSAKRTKLDNSTYSIPDVGDNSDNEEEPNTFAAVSSWPGDGLLEGLDLGALPGLEQIDLNNNTVNEADLERDRMRMLLSNFNEDQMARYEAFRRANINRSAVKKLANAILNQSITGNVAVALSGMSKVFVGEIVEKARDVQRRVDAAAGKDATVEGPLRPEHLREAWRLHKLETGTVPAAHWRRQGGEGDGLMFR